VKLENHVLSMGEEGNAYWVFVGKPDGKRPLGKLGYRWEENVKLDFKDIGWECLDWIRLAHDRHRWQAVVSTVINLHIQYNVGNFLTSPGTSSFSRRTLLHVVGLMCCNH
jgi:hypothetical protein